MELIAEYGKEIISLFVPFVTWFLNSFNKAKANLIWTSPHAFTFLISEPAIDADGKVLRPKQHVETASIRVVNIGRDTANKVELVFNWKPRHINLCPVRHYEYKTDQDDRYILIFDNLSPKEEIGLEIMSVNEDLPKIIHIRSAECTAQEVPMIWIRHVAPWVTQVKRLLLLIGVGATVYLLVGIIQFLVLRTPHGF